MRIALGILMSIGLIFSFIFPIYWVMGDDNIFDFFLNLYGDVENVYTAAYLSCVLVLLIPLLIIGLIVRKKTEEDRS